MPTAPLPLSELVDLSVTVSAAAPSPNGFNQGLIIGDSAVIPSYGASSRLRQYSSTSAMITDGFTTTDPEYLAATGYFSPTPAPGYVWIGRQDSTAISAATPAGRKVTDGDITTATDTLTSVTANFVSGDVGAQVIVVGAGVAGADLVTTIASVTNTTTAVLTASASTTVTAATVYIGAYGVNYKAGDAVGVTQTGGSNGQLTVLTVGTDGQALTLGVVAGTQGTGYSVASNLPTTGGSGTGLEVGITAIGESLLQATTACRAASSAWYGLMVCNPADADNTALSAWADPLWQTTRYYPWTADTAVLNGAANNLFLTLQAAKYRVLPIYSSTQGGLYPNDVYAAATLMGVEMGLNTGLAGSFFSCAYKTLPGVAPEPLTVTQYNNITGAGSASFYGNVYTNFGPYSFVQPGFMSSGDPSYLWLYLAVLVAQIQYNVLDVLQAQTAVPQTNPGEQLLINAVNQACAYLASIGFLAGGVWNGPTVLNLSNGQTLPDGYLVQAQSYQKQSASDRAAGKAMPIYVAITTAGVVQSLLVGVNVQL